MPNHSHNGLYIALISVHGLIRGQNMELGRDSDTGGQVKYVVELARALAQQPGVAAVDLFTRLIASPDVDQDYSEDLEPLGGKARIVRIVAGPPEEYIPKEQLWDYLDSFVDNMLAFFRTSDRVPDLIHSHYADAGYVGSRLANFLNVPLVHTGHSLGRVKRTRLLANGLSSQDIDQRYNMLRRIEAEELTLASAELIITSTRQEVEEQYELYDCYQPERMRVIPPGTDLTLFYPPQGDEWETAIAQDICRFLREPKKPLILALSRPDARKNIGALVKAYGSSEQLQELANLLIVAGSRNNIKDMDAGAQEVLTELFLAFDYYDLYGRVAYPKRHKADEVPYIYRLAALSGGVFVNPALTEPFGLTLIEAAASGLPIVATEDGGPRDIIGNCNNGILIDPLDSDTIVAALLTLLENPEKRQLAVENGLRGVREHYSWEAHASSYLEVIRPLLDKTQVVERVPLSRRAMVYNDRAIVTSLDQNLLGNPVDIPYFVEVLRENRKSTAFAVATGRTLESALKVMRQYHIPEPDVLISSSGTVIHYRPDFTEDTWWKRHIDHRWTPGEVRRVLADLPGLELQPGIHQSQFKISYFYDAEVAPAIQEIKSLLYQEDLAVNVIFSFGQYLDILPIRASKGQALRYVADRWGIPLEHILVAGGSGADEDMMRGNTLAVVVANRHHEELSHLMDGERIYYAKQAHALGIVEAIAHFDFFNTMTEV
ncbi:HAD-IIB family hydrolase [Thermoleptolyngbya sp. C42_A2020_037]|uniref:HAD-IIB family hydrolase n=1 Tax=Thermoleptolyngbya sp. C42_A2020_037 TaxID=2747799 RepID=UPI0019FBA330|nr:HAD-IIB family hydrolase [Thermoleptolyngbya sp. C42_A2020_037]MBF2087038.1 HAD-IIB family hydrolase [Thermoleptolyngbya sp. C42_A2020_037]